MNTPQTILCFEDDIDDLHLICELIGEADPSFSIEHAGNGKEGLDQLRFLYNNSIIPCLIITDFEMPVMKGDEVVTEIRAHVEFKSIPIVIYTTIQTLDKDFLDKYNVFHEVKGWSKIDAKRSVERILRLFTSN